MHLKSARVNYITKVYELKILTLPLESFLLLFQKTDFSFRIILHENEKKYATGEKGRSRELKFTHETSWEYKRKLTVEIFDSDFRNSN